MYDGYLMPAALGLGPRFVPRYRFPSQLQRHTRCRPLSNEGVERLESDTECIGDKIYFEKQEAVDC